NVFSGTVQDQTTGSEWDAQDAPATSGQAATPHRTEPKLTQTPDDQSDKNGAEVTSTPEPDPDPCAPVQLAQFETAVRPLLLPIGSDQHSDRHSLNNNPDSKTTGVDAASSDRVAQNPARAEVPQSTPAQADPRTEQSSSDAGQGAADTTSSAVSPTAD